MNSHVEEHVMVHVLSQEGQPYGSERRCCNHCGVMIWGASALPHVDNWTDWRAAANNCGADTAVALIAEVRRLHLLRQTDRALDVIFRWVDHDLTTRRHASNELLECIDVAEFDEDLLVGFLVATAPGRKVIRTRSDFVNRVRAKLVATIGVDAANALIDELT